MKTLLFVLCTLVPFVAYTQSGYEIINMRGNVTVLRNDTKKWEKAKLFMSISLDDVLSVPKGGWVEILERSSGRADISSEAGKLAVLDRILNARKAAESTFAATNGELYKHIKKQDKSSRPMVTIAATTRGENDTIIADLYDSIYANLLHIMETDMQQEARGLLVEKMNLKENTFSIRATNNTDRMQYFNVVRLGEEQFEVCYYLDDLDFFPVATNNTVDLSSFPLFKSHGRYFVIVSENNLSNRILDATFQGKPILSACEPERVWIQGL